MRSLTTQKKTRKNNKNKHTALFFYYFLYVEFLKTADSFKARGIAQQEAQIPQEAQANRHLGFEHECIRISRTSTSIYSSKSALALGIWFAQDNIQFLAVIF